MKTSKTYRRKELAATIALLLAAYPTVYAQEQADAAAEQTEEMVMEEVIVTGKFRASLISQIDTKRDNSSIVDAISAEDIGKLPDSSVAESLARLPGVSGERRNGRIQPARAAVSDCAGGECSCRRHAGTGDPCGCCRGRQYPSRH